ncbi:MAG: 16S rRNA (adenine(1518)-N(6)/adenine(1519)-N(6))-dimethyltransferase RsmA [Candidatus Brocadiia bacterium]
MNENPANDHPRRLFDRFGLAVNKRYGQNFIVSGELLDKIVKTSGVGPEDRVLEIGTGFGRLTERLAEKTERVITVEIDRGLYKAASQRLADRDSVVMLHEDFLESKHRINTAVTEKASVLAKGGAWTVVSNLPYQISSPAIIDLLDWEVEIDGLYVTLQSEVVDRLTAEPGTKKYGPLTIIVAVAARAERLFSVPPDAFWPAPKVSSDFVALHPLAAEQIPIDIAELSRVVQNIMQSRRKTLRRALKIGWDRAAAQNVLETLKIDPSVRPGKLSPEQYVDIARVLGKGTS